MQAVKISILALLIMYQMIFVVARADVVELSAGVESGRFIEGVNLTDNQLSASVDAEWSADNGAFASLSCFVGERSARTLQRGCDGSLGWFVPVSNDHAFTFAVSRHDYSGPTLQGWEYSDASVSWHIGKDHALKLKASDSLLGRGVNAVTASFHASRQLSDKWRANFEGALVSLESSARVDMLEYGLLSAEYSQGRWATELTVMFSSSDYRRFVIIDLDKPEIGINLRYRIY